MVDLDRDEVKLDIHHIFPKKWCLDRGISPRVFDAIVNKTAVSYKANRMIGGHAPSKYLAQIQGHVQVQLADAPMDAILQSHLIEPSHLRADDFQAFYAARKTSLLRLVEGAMGKAPLTSVAVVDDAEDAIDEDDEDTIT
jgi:hypothetical protein